MARSKLLNYLEAASISSGFDLYFPEIQFMKDLGVTTDTSYLSSINPALQTSNAAGANTRLRAPIVNAILGTLSGQNPNILQRKNIFTVAKNSQKMYCSEQPILDSTGTPTGDYLLAVLTDTRFEASLVVNGGMSFTALPQIGGVIRANEADLRTKPMEGIFAMCLYMLMEFHNDSVADYQKLKNNLAIAGQGGTETLDKNSLSTESIECLFRLCDSVYCAIESEAINIRVDGGNIASMRDSEVRSGVLAGEVLCGWTTPTYLFGANANQASTQTTMMTFGAAKEMFKDWRKGQPEWTEEERTLIPEFPDDYIVMPEAIQLATLAMKTRDNRRPMVNFMWRGITSYGKSTGVDLIAAMLDVPILRMTCNTDMETENFLSKFIPDTSSGKPPAEMPTFEDFCFDPESAYKKITGEFVEGVTPQECLDAFAEAMMAAGRDGGTARYKIVEANFIKALAKGYICELQEVSRIRDPGVLVGLNEYDRPGAFIPLVDGRTVRRHPNALVFYTDNVGYASCRPIDPSVLRRMAYIIDSYDMPKESVIERVVYNTGFDDLDLLDKMYDLWARIAEFCKEHEITDGCVSVTELEMWCQALLVEGRTVDRLKETCKRCVIAKATNVKDEQDEIISGVVDSSDLF